jgi:hypothetical protein
MSVSRAVLITLAVLGVSLGSGGRAGADHNPNGISFRALGIFQGEVSEGTCSVPSAGQLIGDSSGSICRDATEIAGEVGSSTTVFPTRMYPELALFANFCGGFLAMQNNMINQAINVQRVKIRYRIPGRGFPVLCRRERRFNQFIGVRIDPVNSTNPAPFGAVNQALVQLLPIYSADMLDCLRDPTRGNVAAPVTVVARIRALGRRDDGRRIKTNRVRYSLTLLPVGSSPGTGSGGTPPIGNPTRCVPPVQ